MIQVSSEENIKAARELVIKGSWVYIVECRTQHGFVKIGSTTRIFKRMTHLQAGCPYKLEILGLIPGGVELENALQLECAELSLDFSTNREWFERGHQVDRIINRSLPVEAITKKVVEHYSDPLRLEVVTTSGTCSIMDADTGIFYGRALLPGKAKKLFRDLYGCHRGEAVRAMHKLSAKEKNALGLNALQQSRISNGN